MPKKKVKEQKIKVHTCFNIESGQELPSLCACFGEVSREQARQWVAIGLAARIPRGKQKFHQDKICMLESYKRRTPRTATIDSVHILRAYTNSMVMELLDKLVTGRKVGKTEYSEGTERRVFPSLKEKARIEAYGKSDLSDRICVVSAEEFDEGEKYDHGRGIGFTYTRR